MMLSWVLVPQSLLVVTVVSSVGIRVASLTSVLTLAAIAVSPDWRHGGTKVRDQQVLG